MTLTLYNTRTRQKEPFTPLEPGCVGVYSCGPTVYSAQHIGNMRPYMFADLLCRALEGEGLSVTHVVNITDVGHLTDDADAGDDKMEVAAKTAGKRASDIAEEYTAQWLNDRRRLNCRDPDVLCKATDHIAEQVELALELERRGFTYRIEDGIYFDVAKFPRYAEFAGLDLEQGGEARIEGVAGKRHFADFALWKFAAPGVVRQQEWDSPWGRGFPGWHLECSAMSTKFLGQRFDIHTGGVDHIKVHHTNEIAQSEAAFGTHPWVGVWMHNEFLDFRGEKMSKSLGNIYVLDDLVERGFHPLGYRYFFLQAHYRRQQTFTDEAMEAADRGYRRLRTATSELREASGAPDDAAVEQHAKTFRGFVADDLNAPRALALAIEVARDGTLEPATRRALIERFDSWLGLDLLEGPLPEEAAESDPRIDALVAERDAARAAKDFARADEIRDLLAEEGITIADSPAGTVWKRES